MAKNKKEALMDATMEVVAKAGFEGFSMKQVTELAGTAEALVYKHFGTKENLLLSCYEMVSREASRVFDDEPPVPKDMNAAEARSYIAYLWLKYFDYLVSQGIRTEYYFAYRDSNYYRHARERWVEVRKTYSHSFRRLYVSLARRVPRLINVDADILWALMLDTSGIYARRVIRGEMQDTPERRQAMCDVLLNGLFGDLSRKA